VDRATDPNDGPVHNLWVRDGSDPPIPVISRDHTDFQVVGFPCCRGAVDRLAEFRMVVGMIQFQHVLESGLELAGEAVHLVELVRPVQVVTREVVLPCTDSSDILGFRKKVVLTFEFLCRAVSINALFDAVDQEFVLFGAEVFLEVVGHTGTDGVAGDRFTALAGEQNEREVGVPGANGTQKLDAVHPGHIVLGDDTVRGVLPDPLERLVGVSGRVDGEPTTLAFENRRSQVRKFRVVFDVEHPDQSFVHG